MNERIKLPAQEWLGYDPDRGDIHGYTFEQMNEFANLIINECISTLYKEKLSVNEDSDETDWIDATWNSCINHCIGKLNKLQ